MKLKTHTQIFIALALGITAGCLFGPKAGLEPEQAGRTQGEIFSNLAHKPLSQLPEPVFNALEGTADITVKLLKITGEIFIRLLRMIIVPLITASMVTGVVSIGSGRNLGRIGLRTFIYYMSTTFLAVTVGLILVNVISPGTSVELTESQNFKPAAHDIPSLSSIITGIVPKNIIKAMADSQVLSIIFFSLLLGAALTSIGEKAKPVTVFFRALNAVMLKITGWIMLIAPIGVFALMATTVASMGPGVIGDLSKYMATVLLGLGFHAVITLPVMLYCIAKYSPLKFLRHMFSALATAFSTASSAATLPVTMDCLEEKVKVSNESASFVLPLGATVNMDGTALYEAVAAMFIAQAYGIEMSIAQQIIIMLTATLASIGAAAIPGAGLVTMIVVLQAVSLPVEGIIMILAVDRLLDMFRTAVNVWGDSCGTAIIAKLEGENF